LLRKRQERECEYTILILTVQLFQGLYRGQQNRWREEGERDGKEGRKYDDLPIVHLLSVTARCFFMFYHESKYLEMLARGWQLATKKSSRI